MLLRWLFGVCSIRVLAKNHGDPYYEPTIVVHDIHSVQKQTHTKSHTHTTHTHTPYTQNTRKLYTYNLTSYFLQDVPGRNASSVMATCTSLT